MAKSNEFKVGDMIVKFGELCKIVKVEKRKKDTDKLELILHYKPHYAVDHGNDVMYSIPVKNISLTSIRKPISDTQLQDLLKSLSKTIETDSSTNIFDYQQTFNSNNPHELAETLKRIWVEKQESKAEISKAKDDLFKAALKILVEEVAYLKNTSVDEAKKIITRALKK